LIRLEEGDQLSGLERIDGAASEGDAPKRIGGEPDDPPRAIRP
jgi:hypothetical protein